MASGKINYDRETEGGAALREVYKQGAAFRKAVGEMNRALARYNDAEADIAADYGVPIGSVGALKDLMLRADGEMSGVALVAVAQDAQSQTRTLLDSLAIG